MNEELNIEKLTDLAIYYPEYLVDAAVKAFGNDSQKLETIAVVVSGLNDLGMPLNAMFFLQVLSRMLNLEVELPTTLIGGLIFAHGLWVSLPIGCCNM